jgi:ABC-type multidrug transport system fused ATPase/permease subunit
MANIITSITKNDFVKSSFFKNASIIAIMVCIVVYLISYYAKVYVEHDLVPSIQGHTRFKYGKDIFNDMVNNYQDNSESKSSIMVELISLATRDLFLTVYNNILPFIVSFIILSIYFAIYNPKFLLLNVYHLICFVVILCIMKNKTFIETNKSFDMLMKTHETFGDQIKNMLSIIFDNNLKNEEKKLEQIIENTNKQFTKKWRYMDVISTGIIACTYAYLVFFLYFVYNAIKNKELNINTSVKLIIIGLIYVNLSIRVAYDIDKPIVSFVALERFTTYFKKKKHEIDKRLKGKVKNTNIQINSITFKNIYFKYSKSDKYILENLSLTFHKNKLNVILGRSGSGKTTIMKLIIGLYSPQKGDIYLNNINSKKIMTCDITKSIYYVNQRTNLFDSSVLDNMTYGTEVDKTKVIQMLEKYKLIDYFKTLDNSIYTNAGISGSNLSLGMQKIVTVIRGVCKKNKNIIIFDEPLSSIDDATKEKIVKLIINETKGKTIIVITHDKQILPHADNVINLK